MGVEDKKHLPPSTAGPCFHSDSNQRLQWEGEGQFSGSALCFVPPLALPPPHPHPQVVTVNLLVSVKSMLLLKPESLDGIYYRKQVFTVADPWSGAIGEVQNRSAVILPGSWNTSCPVQMIRENWLLFVLHYHLQALAIAKHNSLQ